MTADIFLALFALAFFVLALASYIGNIVKLAKADAIKGLEIVRICGIFIPFLGCIMGFVGNRSK